MQSVLIHYWEKGVPGYTPWYKLPRVKWLCPSPGYDRHFGLTQDLGIENIPVRMTDEGPDMDQVEYLCASDDSIKGMFCVPKYSNPTGITYSDETVRRLAVMKAAPDFRIVWDNAYAVHDLFDEGDELLNIHDVAREVGNEDRILEVASTSKITFPGAGIAFFGSSAANVEEVARTLQVGLISANKLNQLMHARFLPDLDAVRAHMAKHAEFLRPRFAAVEEKLTEGLGGPRLRALDASARRLLRLVRWPARLGQAHLAALRRHGCHAHAGGRHVAGRQRSGRYQPAHRADLSLG